MKILKVKDSDAVGHSKCLNYRQGCRAYPRHCSSCPWQWSGHISLLDTWSRLCFLSQFEAWRRHQENIGRTAVIVSTVIIVWICVWTFLVSV